MIYSHKFKRRAILERYKVSDIGDTVTDYLTILDEDYRKKVISVLASYTGSLALIWTKMRNSVSEEQQERCRASQCESKGVVFLPDGSMECEEHSYKLNQ